MIELRVPLETSAPPHVPLVSANPLICRYPIAWLMVARPAFWACLFLMRVSNNTFVACLVLTGMSVQYVLAACIVLAGTSDEYSFYVSCMVALTGGQTTVHSTVPCDAKSVSQVVFACMPCADKSIGQVFFLS